MPPAKKAFLLRLSEELYADLEIWAERDFRSVNAQIEYILQRMVDQRSAVRQPVLPPLEEPSDPEPSTAAPTPPEDLDLSVD